MPHFVGPGPETDSAAGTIRFLLRLLDEALEGEDSLTRGFEAVERECRGIRQKLRGTEAQLGAAMAALRPFAIAADDLDEKTRDNSKIWESPAAMGIEAKDLRNAKAVLAANPTRDR